MVACGTLLFLAETKRIIALTTGSRKIACRRILDPKVAQVLHQIGFYEAINYRSRISPSAEDVIHWRAIAGIGADGEKAYAPVETVGGRLPPSLSSPMYDGLVEAMTNSAQHAYLQARRDGLGRVGNGEWWMFAKEQDGELWVVFCDLGIGIPNSLPLTHGKSTILELMARIGRLSRVAYSDADLVGAAVEIGRSRTSESHRGKGLKDVLDVINSAGKGGLLIHSNAGSFSYVIQDGRPVLRYRNYRNSILGTLIVWKVPAVQSEGGLSV